MIGADTAFRDLRDAPSRDLPSSQGLLGISGVFAVALGVYSVAVPSSVETARRFWDAGEARSSVPPHGESLLPTRGGALVGLALTF